MYTDTQTHTDGQNDQSLNLLQCSLRLLGGDNNSFKAQTEQEN